MSATWLSLKCCFVRRSARQTLWTWPVMRRITFPFNFTSNILSPAVFLLVFHNKNANVKISAKYFDSLCSQSALILVKSGPVWFRSAHFLSRMTVVFFCLITCQKYLVSPASFGVIWSCDLVRFVWQHEGKNCNSKYFSIKELYYIYSEPWTCRCVFF